jgi:hypothetical protein
MKIIRTANYKKLALHGTFKYICDNCKEFTFLTRRDRSRSAIPRCRYCGSTWLDPVTDVAKDQMHDISEIYDKSVDTNKTKSNFKNRKMDNQFSNMAI